MNTLVGKQAPDFDAKAVQNGKVIDHFSLHSFRGRYVVFFFYPLDFTYVCPTEIIAFQDSLDEFEKRNTQVIGCSIDSHFSHLAWLNTPRQKGGIQGINYPLVSDINKTICKDYGVLMHEEGISYRGLFIIDKEGKIRHMVVNDLPLGRSVSEVLRLLDALQHFEQNGDVCPANWSVGKASMQPSKEGLEKWCSSQTEKVN